MNEPAADTQPQKQLRRKFRPGPSGKKSIYLTYKPVRRGVAAPSNPLFRYQTNKAGYFTCKYLVPAAAAFTYITFFVRSLVVDSSGLAYALLSPTQLFCLAVLPLALYLTAPLAHIIVCEEGMFVRNGVKRVFVPWKYLRSYRPSLNLNPWVIIISYYVAKGRHRRVFAITSLATEHALVEIVNFIHKVRRNTEPEPDV
jgi:hypothetical protein